MWRGIITRALPLCVEGDNNQGIATMCGEDKWGTSEMNNRKTSGLEPLTNWLHADAIVGVTSSYSCVFFAL